MKRFILKEITNNNSEEGIKKISKHIIGQNAK